MLGIMLPVQKLDYLICPAGLQELDTRLSVTVLYEMIFLLKKRKRTRECNITFNNEGKILFHRLFHDNVTA